MVSYQFLHVNGQGLTFVYVDSEQWVGKHVQNAEDTEFTSGGAEFYTSNWWNRLQSCGDFKIHTFTGPGTFTVNGVFCFQRHQLDTLKYLT